MSTCGERFAGGNFFVRRRQPCLLWGSGCKALTHLLFSSFCPDQDKKKRYIAAFLVLVTLIFTLSYYEPWTVKKEMEVAIMIHCLVGRPQFWWLRLVFLLPSRFFRTRNDHIWNRRCSWRGRGQFANNKKFYANISFSSLGKLHPCIAPYCC